MLRPTTGSVFDNVVQRHPRREANGPENGPAPDLRRAGHRGEPHERCPAPAVLFEKAAACQVEGIRPELRTVDDSPDTDADQ